jgi:hypothetical protein
MTLLLRTLLLLASLAWMPVEVYAQDFESAEALLAKYKAEVAQLANNPFQRKLVLESIEGSGKLSGNIYAVLDHRFDDVGNALTLPAVWCGVLMLHLNIKHCAVQGAGASPTLQVAIGRKFDQPVADASRVDFVFQLKAATADYLDVSLRADTGPMSTRDYRISLQATPLDGKTTFIHMGYSYGYGTAAKLAMQVYLATIGSDKVGFTVTGNTAQGAPEYIGSVRGVVERNTMRYYLAIDAYLDAPNAGQLDQRLAGWFDATEQYARQLHELSREDYLSMKHREHRRLATGP